MKATIKTLFLLLALFTIVHGAIRTPLGSKAERTSELQNALPNNELVKGDAGKRAAERVVALQDEIIANGGCNANICFGLDGSGLITNKNYERQRQFVQLIAASVGVDTSVKMSAYQYGLRLRSISKYTKDINQFLRNMENAERMSDLDRSYLAPALFRCQLDFRQSVEDANNIVIIGDGRTNYGRPSQAVRIAERFLPPNNNGAITAVYVGNPAFRFLEKITQNPNMIIDVEDYFGFINILDDVVKNVCDLV